MPSPEIPNAGYRPQDNPRRLSYIEKEIASNEFTMLDVGSNFGFFSLNMAKKYPSSKIYSVEGSLGTGNNNNPKNAEKSPGVTTHKSIRDKLKLNNNKIFCALLDHKKIKQFADIQLAFDYQISLSTLHWVALLIPNRKVEDSEELLINHLRMARTTFLEVPAVAQRGTTLSKLYERYKDNIKLTIEGVANKYEEKVSIKHLGSCNFYGTRDTYRIDIGNDNAPLDNSKFEEILNCKAI